MLSPLVNVKARALQRVVVGANRRRPFCQSLYIGSRPEGLTSIITSFGKLDKRKRNIKVERYGNCFKISRRILKVEARNHFSFHSQASTELLPCMVDEDHVVRQHLMKSLVLLG